MSPSNSAPHPDSQYPCSSAVSIWIHPPSHHYRLPFGNSHINHIMPAKGDSVGEEELHLSASISEMEIISHEDSIFVFNGLPARQYEVAICSPFNSHIDSCNCWRDPLHPNDDRRRGSEYTSLHWKDGGIIFECMEMGIGTTETTGTAISFLLCRLKPIGSPQCFSRDYDPIAMRCSTGGVCGSGWSRSGIGTWCCSMESIRMPYSCARTDC